MQKLLGEDRNWRVKRWKCHLSWKLKALLCFNCVYLSLTLTKFQRPNFKLLIWQHYMVPHQTGKFLGRKLNVFYRPAPVFSVFYTSAFTCVTILFHLYQYFSANLFCRILFASSPKFFSIVCLPPLQFFSQIFNFFCSINFFHKLVFLIYFM